MSGPRPSRCPAWPGTSWGGRDRLPRQERGDQLPVVPALQQAPGAGDRDTGEHWRDHAGGGLQRPPPGQLHLLLPGPWAVTKQGAVCGIVHVPIVRQALVPGHHDLAWW